MLPRRLKSTMCGDHVHSVLHSKILISAMLSMCLLLYAGFVLRHLATKYPPQEELIPMIQFDRGGFTKADILDSNQLALHALAKLTVHESEAVDENGDIPLMKYLLDVEDRKTRRQLLAMEALGLSSESDFHVLSELGYNSSVVTKRNEDASLLDYYKSFSETIEYRTPNFERLIFETTFSLDNRQRLVDKSFHSRLQSLDLAIKAGTESPLLTLFTWWPDPVSDGEILSRKSMIANWNLLRPFVVPVVFTNDRMNMAFANGNGWPCFPATETNVDGLPVFQSLTRFVASKSVSTFYGYAKPIAMFDFSILETLMAIKHRYVNPGIYKENLKFSPMTDSDQGVLQSPIAVHGSSFKMAHPGPDPFVNFERLYKYLRENDENREKVSIENSNYFIYRNIDFDDAIMPPLVIHDDFLFRFVVDLSIGQGYMVIDASKTLLSIQTYRSDRTNEWGRRYLQTKPPDPLYNRRLAPSWYSDQGKQLNAESSRHTQHIISMNFDTTDGSCVFVESNMETN